MSIAPAPTQVQPPQPSSPGMGTSPVTQPVPNKGNEVMAMKQTALLVDLMGKTIAVAGGGSELGLALADCIRKLSKFTQQAASTPQGDQEALRALMMRQQQMSQLGQPKPPGTP